MVYAKQFNTTFKLCFEKKKIIGLITEVDKFDTHLHLASHGFFPV